MIDQLMQDLADGRLTRRELMGRGTALGLSATAIGAIARSPGAAFAADATPAAAEGVPGPAVDSVTYGAFNVDQAPLNIQNGDIDVYLFSLKNAGAKSLDGAANVRLIKAPASTLSLILNPAPGNDGELNPFSIIEVRRAMQHLVDRDFIANDIYQGQAAPMVTNVSPFDYDQLTVFPVVSAANIRYDAELAKQQITTAMQAAGAQIGGDGKWAFNGNPIVIKIITRVEDERRDIGDLVRAALEGVGFQVQPQYQQFGPATLAVYTSDPKTFQWHVYTEGWGRGATTRYDDFGINSFAAPWLGNMPGWQAVGFWQYQQQDLDDLGKKLYRGQFGGKDERDKLFQQMAKIALDESVRVWLVTALQSFPVRTDVTDITEDLVSGPKNIFAMRGAQIAGRKEIKAGNLWVWTDRTTWNPVGGNGDSYSQEIYRNLVDPPLVDHPFTGIPEPFRAAFAIDTAGPAGTMPVPADAVVWDAKGDAWVPAAAGATTVSKVTFDYAKLFQSTWHHGPPITMADVLYSIAQGFEIANDEAKVQIETSLGITSRPLLETYKGFRLVDAHTLEVYVDYWHFEPSYIASYASPTGVSTPWEVLAAMDDVVFEKRQGAYTDNTAARFSVPWLSLVTDSDARLTLRSIKQFKRQKSVPKGYFEIGGQSLVSPDDAVARYDACDAWFAKTNLLVIGNGAFQLTKYDPPAQFAQIDAFREAKYPFSAADFRYGAPPKLAMTASAPPTLNIGDPITLPVTITGPGKLSLEYTLIDPSKGEVVDSGAAQGGDAGAFTVAVDPAKTATLFPGVYQLYLLASSDAIAEVVQQRVDLNIGV
ncbi:MAG: ABC transporter substrate-binding protein [Thermomicrobiales bacterium]